MLLAKYCSFAEGLEAPTTSLQEIEGVADYLIINDGSYSFADNGLMETVRAECRVAMDNFGG
jgi:hypothetical protein